MILREGELSPVHSDIVRLSLKTYHYYVALPLLTASYTFVDRKGTGLTPEDVVLFFYYAGCLALATNQRTKALDLFEQSMSVPGRFIHAASIEAFKKYTLTYLLIYGQEA